MLLPIRTWLRQDADDGQGGSPHLFATSDIFARPLDPLNTLDDAMSVFAYLPLGCGSLRSAFSTWLRRERGDWEEHGIISVACCVRGTDQIVGSVVKGIPTSIPQRQ